MFLLMLPDNCPDFYPRPPRGGRPAPMAASGCMSRFLSTPSARRATKVRVQRMRMDRFLSTPSARRATCADQHRFDHKGISIHALREEGDEGSCMPYGLFSPFLSTPSARRATFTRTRESAGLTFLSTPSARRATQQISDYVDWLDISIHALREEGDAAALA